MGQIVYVFPNKNELINTAASKLSKFSPEQAIRAIGVDEGVSSIRKALFASSYLPDNRELGVSKLLGNLVLSNLDISGDSYFDDSGKKISFPDLNFDAVLFEVRNVNNIVRTPIQGRRGTVKQYIGGGDWEIFVRGVISGNNGKYPDKGNGAGGDDTNTVDALVTALNSNIELNVNSWFLTLFGIYKIVILDKNFYQEEGTYSSQKFTFQALSDEDYVVNLKQ